MKKLIILNIELKVNFKYIKNVDYKFKLEFNYYLIY
jgi:hypothetical protein